MTTLKGLPSAYDKDLQEDKVPVFNAFDTLISIIPVLAEALKTLKVYPEQMRSRVDTGMLATDLADYLVLKGIPFREAHTLAGKAVARATELGVSLDQMSLEEYQNLNTAFDAQVYETFDPDQSIAKRASYGGTAKSAVLIQLKEAKARL
jgi:argininosuccinate lyase